MKTSRRLGRSDSDTLTEPRELRRASRLPSPQTAWLQPASVGRAADSAQLAHCQPDITQQPLRARWTYCHWCGRRCSPKETATTPCGVPVHYPCLELHISRCKDCRRIVDKDENLLAAKEPACQAGDKERSQGLTLRYKPCSVGCKAFLLASKQMGMHTR